MAVIFLSSFAMAPFASATAEEVSQLAGAHQQEAAAAKQGSTFIANMLAPPPNIALKVQPAKTLRFTKSQLNGLLIDLRHEVKAQVCWHTLIRSSPQYSEPAADGTFREYNAYNTDFNSPRKLNNIGAGQMAEEERRRQRTASTWSLHGAPIWVPKESR